MKKKAMREANYPQIKRIHTDFDFLICDNPKNLWIKNLLFCFVLFSLFIPAFGLEMPSQFVEAGMGYVAAKNVEREFNPFNLSYGIQSKSDDRTWLYDGLASVQFSEKIFDFTIYGDYFFPWFSWKSKKSKMGFGARLLYHFQRYYDLYSEHDFYFEPVFRVASQKIIFLANLGVGWKAAKIDVLNRDALWDWTLSGSLALNYYFENGAELYGSIVSHEIYRYPLAFTPTNYLGFAWNFKNGFRISTDIGIRLRDWFVVAPYVDRYEWNLKARFTF